MEIECKKKERRGVAGGRKRKEGGGYGNVWPYNE